MVHFSFKHYLLLVGLHLSFAVNGFTQVLGCKDPAAINYNAAATVNDGSCLYATTTITASVRCNLPDSLTETSGLLLHHGKLFSNTDSGTPNVFFQIDTLSGAIRKKITVTNASNVDWEELCSDSLYVYLGDFGNNNGNRTDLKIVRVPWSAIDTAYSISDTATFISFAYADQTDFTAHPNANRFDCEAMISLGDSLYLFSKDWVYGHTRVYRIPKQPGNYTAVLIDSFDVKGLITGASFDSIRNKVMLIGYTTTGLSFVWQLWDFNGAQFFKGNKRRIELGFAGQTEGIAWLDQHRLLLSNEGYSIIHQRLQVIDDRSWQTVSGFRAVKKKMDQSYSIFPNPCSVSFSLDHKPNAALIELYTIEGKRLLATNRAEVNVSNLPNGTYHVVVDGRVVGPLIVEHR